MKAGLFQHRYFEGASDQTPVLLLLHGTGGTEDDLIPLGRELAPGAAILSPRGRVSEIGAARFFRRFAEGVFDLDDLRAQTDALAEFVEASSKEYRFAGNRIVAVGYSNGANIASSLMFRHPGVLAGAVLFRAMVPFRPKPLPTLTDVPVLIAAGERDPIVPKADTLELAEIFAQSGAAVSTHWYGGGHELSRGDLDAAKQWFRGAGCGTSAVSTRMSRGQA
jgi:phospholipase/carboxylesterase